MDINIKKKPYFKRILNYLIEKAPNGVYAGELCQKFGNYKTIVKDVVWFLEGENAVKLDHHIINDKNIDVKNMYLIWPNKNKLLKIKKETPFVIFIREVLKPSTLIAFGSLIVSIVSLIISLR